MNAPTGLAALRAEIEVLLWRFGWAWPLAILMGLSAAALHFTVFVPARSALVAASTRLSQAALTGPVTRPIQLLATEEQRVEALQAVLRTESEPAELIRKIDELSLIHI